MDLELRGRVAIVAGGRRGIGKSVARVLAEEGADLALVARRQPSLAATVEEIAGAKTVSINGDAISVGGRYRGPIYY